MEILIPIIAIVVPCAVGFGAMYMYYTSQHKERMSMIERGMAPSLAKPADDPNKALRNGMLWTGVGIGLTLGWLFRQYVMQGTEAVRSPIPLLVGAALFGGLSQVLYYLRFHGRQQG
jgi:hypothetical protein